MTQCTTSGPIRHSQPDLAWGLIRHERLVGWVVRRQWLGRLPYADALQVGRVGLWRALQGYDAGRGYAFSSYAVPIIARHIWQAVARATRSSPEVLTPHPPQPGPDLDELAQRQLIRQALSPVVDCLPEPLHTVIVARYGLTGAAPQTLAAIGQTLHLTRQRVHQLHIEALLWLAHPARSWVLRQYLDRNSVADYRRYLARQRAWQRGKRGVR